LQHCLVFDLEREREGKKRSSFATRDGVQREGGKEKNIVIAQEERLLTNVERQLKRKTLCPRTRSLTSASKEGEKKSVDFLPNRKRSIGNHDG